MTRITRRSAILAWSGLLMAACAPSAPASPTAPAKTETNPKGAGRPKVASRPDLGVGAFTLTATTAPVATAYFPVGKSVVTLSVDLVDAGAWKRDLETVDRILALAHNRLR